MKNLIRRISATVLGAIIIGSALMTSASAYVVDVDWSINYVAQLPSRPDGQYCAELELYSGGYLTYCSNIYGANNRSVSVIPTGITEYSITTTGFSSVHKTSSTKAPVYFNFYGRGSTTCVAYGTVGYNMTVNE